MWCSKVTFSQLLVASLLIVGQFAVLTSAREATVIQRTASVHAASPSQRVFLEQDGKAYVPHDWVRLNRVEPHRLVKLYFAVKLSNTARLAAVADAVSNPASPQYGHYLTLEQVNTMTRSSTKDTSAVLTFVNQLEGVHNVRVTPGGEYISCHLPAAQVESVLQVQLSHYVHRQRRDIKLMRADRPYSLPADIARSVDYVDGVSRFPNVRTPKIVEHPEDQTVTPNKLPLKTCGGKCWVDLTPTILKTRYNVTALGKDSSNTQAVAEFAGQYYNPKNLKQFLTDCQQTINPVSKVDGPNIPEIPGIESTLDIEWIMAMGGNISTEFWSLSEYSLSDWLMKIANTSDAPLVHSVSYGNDEVQNGLSYMERVNAELQKAAARGLSIIFASGDQGVYGRTGGSSTFHPDFPGGSPYVTAVGATQFKDDTIGQEVGSSWSGGGFSNTFARPSYQQTAVENYISSQGDHLPPQQNWNKTGRGYPDVSANGGGASKFCILVSDLYTGVSGTSASAPTFAGIISLLNDLRLSAGKPQLGFLNPWIYNVTATAGAFDDVVDCDGGSNGAGSGTGFAAAAGWDPVSGVGNPNYAVLAKAVLQ